MEGGIVVTGVSMAGAIDAVVHPLSRTAESNPATRVKSLMVI
jgi:hypothetical protein